MNRIFFEKYKQVVSGSDSMNTKTISNKSDVFINASSPVHTHTVNIGGEKGDFCRKAQNFIQV